MPKRILVVDDTILNRKLAMAMLKREGWEAEEADCGLRALELLDIAPGFDAVLLDISMPGIGGDEVCRQIRATPQLAALPVVAYTAHALEEEKSRILAAGFDAILIKPINAASLSAAIAEAFAAHSRPETLG
jgi:two-component system, chemotaxis family, chemotaxis protein CheY